MERARGARPRVTLGGVRTLRPGVVVVLLGAFAAAAVGGTGAFLLWRYRAATLADRTERAAMLVGARARLVGDELGQLVSEMDRLSRLAEIDLADQTLEPEKRVLKIARRDTIVFSAAIAVVGADGDVLWAEPRDARPRTDPAALVALARGRGRASTAYAPGEIVVAAPVAGHGAIVAIVPERGGRDVFGEALRSSVRDAGSLALVRPGPGGLACDDELGAARAARRRGPGVGGGRLGAPLARHRGAGRRG